MNKFNSNLGGLLHAVITCVTANSNSLAQTWCGPFGLGERATVFNPERCRMKIVLRRIGLWVFACVLCGLLTSTSYANCRGVMDTNGTMWVRIKLENSSPSPVTFAIWDCRTAVDSTDTTAVTDFSGGPGPTVNPGETRVVWLYGGVVSVDADTGEVTTSDLDIKIASQDAITYSGSCTPQDGADGEWVVTIAADGSMSESLELGATYVVPVQFAY